MSQVVLNLRDPLSRSADMINVFNECPSIYKLSPSLLVNYFCILVSQLVLPVHGRGRKRKGDRRAWEETKK